MLLYPTIFPVDTEAERYIRVACTQPGPATSQWRARVRAGSRGRYGDGVIIRCTGKVQKIVGRPDPQAAAIPADPNDWYANVVWIQGRKCLLATHAGTLFSVFIPDVRAHQLRPLGPLLINNIHTQLAAAGLPTDTFELEISDPVTIAKTADRSVLGCMNDLTGLCEHLIAIAGGLAHVDLDELHNAMQHNIVSARSYVPAIELAANWPSSA